MQAKEHDDKRRVARCYGCRFSSPQEYQPYPRLWPFMTCKACEDKALASLKEEANDVLIVLVILGLADQSVVHDWRKLVRWAERIQETNEKKEAANGHAER